MATLVLTAVGTAVGGPIGGALGALVGQAVDRSLFAPKGREGARLADLALQTSSYGTAIPRLFGTLRVAGTVIWATDLKETRSTSRSGKGQPSTTSYSYSASFAVALSGRPIRGVRRIWADGNLLRGAAGDWKTATGFRLHLGGEDQAADPLIASAEGSAAPAHRGIAYAVFEAMPLGDFGNRIPQLTFEVVADEAPVSVGAIAAALAPEVAGAAELAVDGYAAAGATVREVLDTLATIGSAWWRIDGERLTLLDRAKTAVAVSETGVPARSVAAASTHAVSVSHYDAARDYQTGVQRAAWPEAGARGEQRLALPAVLSGAAARGIAEARLIDADLRRTRRTVETGLAALTIVPGDCVALAGEAGMWRVAEARLEAMRVRLTLVPVGAAPVPVVATSGRVLPASDVAAGPTVLHVAELPGPDDTLATAPRLSVIASGTGSGWRRAALLYSLDGGASWQPGGATALPAVTGRIEEAPGAATALLRDDMHAVVVRLDRGDMLLGDADPAMLDAGANLALVGDELVQFARAEPLGGARWRLSGLLRGRRGSEAAIGLQRPGDRFALIEPEAVRTIELPASALGATVRVLASGTGDAEPVEAVAAVTGASVLPPAPVGLRAARLGGGWRIDWVRRSRLGWRWSDGVDAPLGEEREAYLVTVADEPIETDAPWLTLPDRPAPFAMTVRQRGTFGLSAAATMMVEER